MNNFRYNPIDSSDYVNYKPDVVAAARSTSEGTPMITGIVAMMLQLKPSLATHPELVKAILMASCHRKALPYEGTSLETMEEGLTQRQGAGAVDAYTAICIVLQGNYGINEFTADSAFSDISILPSSNGNVNVSIAWLYDGILEVEAAEKINDIHGNWYIPISPLRELELDVLDNNQNVITHSERKNTGKQMAYFSNASLDDFYTIRVTKKDEISEPIKYAYAWSTSTAKEEPILHRNIFINNALSEQHDINLDTEALYDTIVE